MSVSVRRYERGKPSVTALGRVYQSLDSAGCQSRDGREENEMHFIPGLLRVNCDRVAPQLPSISTSPRHPSHLPLSSSPSPRQVCVRSARSMQGRKTERRVGAGWRAPTIGSDFIVRDAFPEAFFFSWLIASMYLPELHRGFVCFHLAEQRTLCVNNWTINTDRCHR